MFAVCCKMCIFKCVFDQTHARRASAPWGGTGARQAREGRGGVLRGEVRVVHGLAGPPHPAPRRAPVGPLHDALPGPPPGG